jgi:glycosyltransferase involved in cell wall biosynthesis
MDNVTLSIHMIAYNHGDFIAKAIESVLMQQTQFSYQLVIGEDCSTDTTLKICKEFKNKYPDRIKLLPSDKNYGMMDNFIRTMKACTGKYIAICEGDDYWTDPLKLQKQVDILEANDNIGLVYTNYSIVDEVGNTIESKKYKALMPCGNIINELVKGQFPWTLTACFRKNLLEGQETLILKDHYLMGDFPLWLHLGVNSQFEYIPDVTSSYRRNEGSATDPNRSYLKKIDFIYSWKNILSDFINENNIIENNLLTIIMTQLSHRLLYAFIISIQNNDFQIANKIWLDIKENGTKIPYKYNVLRIFMLSGKFGKFLINLYFKLN